MKLTNFLKDLFLNGQVTVQNKLNEFNNLDLEESLIILKEFYNQDKLNMPFEAPQFSDKAALWSSIYFYHAVQLTVLRNFGQNTVIDLLKDFEGEINPDAIYSVDLIFRHLPQLFNFVKSLSPDDILLQTLKKTAINWSYSSVGMEIEEQFNSEIILSDKSLSLSYIDKIIEYNDIKRVNNKQIIKLIDTALGNYPEVWTDYQLNKEILVKKYND